MIFWHRNDQEKKNFFHKTLSIIALNLETYFVAQNLLCLPEEFLDVYIDESSRLSIVLGTSKGSIDQFTIAKIATDHTLRWLKLCACSVKVPCSGIMEAELRTHLIIVLWFSTGFGGAFNWAPMTWISSTGVPLIAEVLPATH